MFISLAREGGRVLQTTTPNQKHLIITKLANLLLERQRDILDANSKDIEMANKSGMDNILKCRPEKLKLWLRVLGMQFIAKLWGVNILGNEIVKCHLQYKIFSVLKIVMDV